MNFLKKATDKVLEKVGLSTGNYDEQLEQYKNRLEHLENTITQFKKGFDTYSKAMQAQGNAISSLSQDLTTFYTRPEDKRTLSIFHETTQHLADGAQRIFKETYGWDILQSFDEWDAETKKIHAEIKKVESARTHLEATEKSVTAMRTAKAAGRAMTKQDEEKLQAGEDKWEKYKKAYGKMRTALDGQVTAHVDARYSTLDHMFYRLMEFQLEYYRAGVQSVDPLQGLVDSYRKKAPTFETKQQSTPASAPASARSPSPVPAPAPKPGSKSAREPITNGKKAKKPDPESEEDEEDPFEEEEDTEEDDSDEETPAPQPVKKQTSKPSPTKPSPQASPSLDIFGGFDSPPAAQAPVKKSSSAQPAASSGDLFDLFSSAPAPAATTAKPPKPASSSTSTPDLDNLFGDFASSAKAQPKAQSTKSATLGPNLSKSASHDGGLGDIFDPFSSAKPSPMQQRATTPQPRPTPSQTTPSSTQPTSARKTPVPEKQSFEVGSAGLEKVIKDAQEEKLREIREREKKAEAEAKAKEQALGGLEDKLKSWEFKDGQQKNIRNLLQGVHNVLWPELGWKPPSLTDLMDFNGIKKFHRKAVILLHPDKLVHCTPEQKVIGERVFDVLQSAFDKYKDQQVAGGQAF